MSKPADTLLPAQDGRHDREDTWKPGLGADMEDGRTMNALLWSDPELHRVRDWIAPPTEFVVSGALEMVERRLETVERGDVVRVLDYGSGTGLAAVEFLKASRSRGIEERLARVGARLELHIVDRPNPWFAHGFTVLSTCRWTRFHSLVGADGGFRPLLEATAGRTMDAVMVANVFHLIPARALERAGADVASAVAPGGRLTWCSPDLQPAGANAVLFHDANRMLRKRWVELLATSSGPPGTEAPGASELPIASRAAARARDELDEAAREAAQRRAEAHILSDPNPVDLVMSALGAHLSGDLERPVHETRDRDLLDALLVPSIQAEYMAEIEDRDEREQVIRELMLEAVLPAMEARGARTPDGVNVRWNHGSFHRPG